MKISIFRLAFFLCMSAIVFFHIPKAEAIVMVSRSECGIADDGSYISTPTCVASCHSVFMINISCSCVPLCNVGIPTTVTDSGNTYDWKCISGWNNSSIVSCNANKIVSGLCGSSDGQILENEPSSNLCEAGYPTAVSGSDFWTWSCVGSSGGSTAACSAQKTTPTYDCVATSSCSQIYDYTEQSFAAYVSSSEDCSTGKPDPVYSLDCACGSKISDPFNYKSICENPMASITASPASISQGQQSIISWNTSNTAACWASGDWSGWKSNTGGSEPITISTTGNKIFNIECWNDAGISTGIKSVNVDVACVSDGIAASNTCIGSTATDNCGNIVSGTKCDSTCCSAVDYCGSAANNPTSTEPAEEVLCLNSALPGVVTDTGGSWLWSCTKKPWETQGCDQSCENDCLAKHIYDFDYDNWKEVAP